MNKNLKLINIRRLTHDDAVQYRNLMLNAYALYPEAFTTSAQERRDLPIDFWSNRLSEDTNAKEVVFGAFIGSMLAGVVGLL